MDVEEEEVQGDPERLPNFWLEIPDDPGVRLGEPKEKGESSRLAKDILQLQEEMNSYQAMNENMFNHLNYIPRMSLALIRKQLEVESEPEFQEKEKRRYREDTHKRERHSRSTSRG